MTVAVAARTREQTLTLLVLAAGRGACLGVDLATGAFVMPQWPSLPGAAPALSAFDVAVAPVSDDQEPFDPVRPEAVVVDRPPHSVGRLRRRPAERFLRPLLLPAASHLLGFPAGSLPYWTLAGDRPSMCLVAPSGGVAVTADRTCRFQWRGVQQDLPLADAVLPAGALRGRPRITGAPLAELLGFVPRRVLVALSAPHSGVCHKVAAALLP
jgi:hypothetical protein